MLAPAMRDLKRLLWTHFEWRCELHSGIAGQGRLEVYRGDDLKSAESVPTGNAAYLRAEVLRQRAVRGDLRP
jgi:hypothetical protein